MCLGRQKEQLRKGICSFLLLFFCFSPQAVMSIELKSEASPVHNLNVTSDSLLLQEASFLALDRYSIQMVSSDEYLLDQLKNTLVYGDANALLIASNASNLEASHEFKKVNVLNDVLNINPQATSLRFPPLVQPPEKSSLPDPLSLLMLSIGAITLLMWSRRKRHF